MMVNGTGRLAHINVKLLHFTKLLFCLCSKGWSKTSIPEPHEAWDPNMHMPTVSEITKGVSQIELAPIPEGPVYKAVS